MIQNAYKGNDGNFLIDQIDQKVNILAVEDDFLTMKFLKKHIAELGHCVLAAEDGRQALSVLEENKEIIDVVLMDREMPVMDGLEAVKRIKEHPSLRRIPVIMVTSADTVQEMDEGLTAGVFYYLTKPVDPSVLHSVLLAALREARQNKILTSELGKHKTSFQLADTCKFYFSTLAETENLATFTSNFFPDPERVIQGLGELMINAIEHGNLGLGYERKTELVQNQTWRAEIERLQNLQEHSQKRASITIARKNDGVYVIIEDQGDGFEWKKFIDIDPTRAGDNHGRGIAQARIISFDKLNYNDAGNKVIAFVHHGEKMEW